MRILQVVHGFPPNNNAGTEVYTYNLSRELAKKHKVYLICRTNDLNKKEYEVVSEKIGNLEIFRVNNNFKLYKSFEDTYKNNDIAAIFGHLLNQVSPDIVHIQHLLYLSTAVIEKIKKRKIPIVFTLHDYWLICPQGQLFKRNQYPCLDIDSDDCFSCVSYQLSIASSVFNSYYLFKKKLPESLLRSLMKMYVYFRKIFFLRKLKLKKILNKRKDYIKVILQQVDFFIAPSRFLMKRFIDFGIPQEKIVDISLGINFENFSDYRKNYSKKIRFGFIGNILPAKGLHVLIKAFDKIDNGSAELLIYGKDVSYKSIFEGYSRYIKKISRDKNIIFKGGFVNDKISEILSNIDVLVVPSLWYENAPLVIQEAFASKTPVIASRIGGIPELINEGVNGLLFNPGDFEGLRRVLISIIGNRKILEEIKNNIALPKSIEHNVQEIEEVYRKALGRC